MIRNKISLLSVLLIIFISIPIASALTVQNLNYDSNQSEVNITYDSLNRIITKNTSSTNYSYTYDFQYQGTLTNVSFGNESIKYTYDIGLRVIEEIKVIDGIEFKKNYYYDSSDRIVKVTLSSGQSIEYFYNEQGQIDEIKGIINSTKHNPLDKPLNRTYANNLTTNFTYDSQTLRLTEIKTSTVQRLTYSYDQVGNIIAINDTVNNRNQTMTYDSLDRLLGMSINGGQSFVYSYNAIGNILKIVRDSKNTTKFVYGTRPVHAPSQIIIGDSGIDVLNEDMLYSNGTQKVVQFYIYNENNGTLTNINWSAVYGDNTGANGSINFNLEKNDSVLIIVENTYATAGDYNINISSLSSQSYDYEAIPVKLGIKIPFIAVLNNTLSNVAYKLKIFNDINLDSPSLNWSCNNGIFATILFSMSANEILDLILEHNYTSPGIKLLNCTAVAGSSNDSIALEFEIKGIKIENFNITKIEENRINISFDIRNYYYPLNVTYNISSDGQSYTGTSYLGTDQATKVSQEINYTTDGTKAIVVSINATNTADLYNISTIVKGLEIEEYKAYNRTPTHKIMLFTIANYWPSSLDTVWNLSDPTLSSSNFTLADNESVFVIVENNYSTQGDKNPEITAYSNQFKESVEDIFQIKLISLKDYEVVFEGSNASVIRAYMANNVEGRDISWTLDTGLQNVTSSQLITLNNQEELIAIIEAGYNRSGVFSIVYRMNSSSLNDNVTGVVVIS